MHCVWQKTNLDIIPNHNIGMAKQCCEDVILQQEESRQEEGWKKKSILEMTEKHLQYNNNPKHTTGATLE